MAWCFSSCASQRSNKVKARGGAAAKPAIDLIFVQATYLAGITFHHGIAGEILAIAASRPCIRATETIVVSAAAWLAVKGWPT